MPVGYDRVFRLITPATKALIIDSMFNMSIPHHKIFYSQNREDLILAGFLRKVSTGFYVDVGANHPEQDSVTKLFYDQGWSGINIEPNENKYAELCRQRPRDINIRIGLSSQSGTSIFRTYANDGLSTFSSDSKQMYESLHFSHVETSVGVSTLSEILTQHRATGDIHFLKVDAEGLELEILLGNSWQQFRPWVLCIERAVFHPRRAAISAFLEAWSYTHVFFDGINDYLVANEKRAVGDEFSYLQTMILEGIPLHYIFARQIAFETPQVESATVKPVFARGEAAAPLAIREPMASAQALLALDGEKFVYAAYATILNRAPDTNGLANYLLELRSGVSKISIASRLRNSDEGRQQTFHLTGYRKALIWSWLKRSFMRGKSENRIASGRVDT